LLAILFDAVKYPEIIKKIGTSTSNKLAHAACPSKDEQWQITIKSIAVTLVKEIA